MNDQIETSLSLVRKATKIDKEVWVKIKGSETYEISNLCRIRTIKMKTYLPQGKIAKGYRSVSLMNVNGKRSASYYMHRLMAEAFLPNPENKRCVNHINGNKSDNSIKNLEWVTHSENAIHAHANGLHDVPRLKGENHPMAQLNENDVIDILKMGLICEFRAEKISKFYNMHKSTICYILKGKLWPEQYKAFDEIFFQRQ